MNPSTRSLRHVRLCDRGNRKMKNQDSWWQLARKRPYGYFIAGLVFTLISGGYAALSGAPVRSSELAIGAILFAAGLASVDWIVGWVRGRKL